MKKKLHPSASRVSKIKKSQKKVSARKKIKMKNPQAVSEENNIISLILKDHHPLKELVTLLKDSELEMSKKIPAYIELEHKLTNHATAEEQSLYVHLKNEDFLRLRGLEGETEHIMADRLMKEINQISKDNDLWMAKVKVLAEFVDHHINEEETELLKEVEKEFSPQALIEMGREYASKISELRKHPTSRIRTFEPEISQGKFA
jgi:hemerythrin superfamily protein